VPLMEEHFGIRVLDEAVTEAVRLSHRYISGRQLPDKAVGVLDTACAKVALGQSATPAVIEDTRRHLERLEAAIGALEREAAGGEHGHGEKLEELRAQREQARGLLAQSEERLARENALAAQIHALREQMRSAPARHAAGQPMAEATEPA